VYTKPPAQYPISVINPDFLASGCDSAKFWARANVALLIWGGLIISSESAEGRHISMSCFDHMLMALRLEEIQGAWSVLVV
jgi:hypothetical protein